MDFPPHVPTCKSFCYSNHEAFENRKEVAVSRGCMLMQSCLFHKALGSIMY